MADDRRSANHRPDQQDYNATGRDPSVLDFVKRGKVRRGALQAVLNDLDDSEPGRLENTLAGLARARTAEGEKHRYFLGDDYEQRHT